MVYKLYKNDILVQKTTFSSLEESHFHYINFYNLKMQGVLESVPDKLLVFLAYSKGVSDRYKIERTTLLSMWS